jgi:hypothetical protein
VTDALTLDFGPGRYTFRLPMARIIEVERLCGDKSIVAMYEEMSAGIGIGRDDDEARFVGAGTARIKDVFEIIRCAAIGGGEAEIAGETVKVAPNDAARLVSEYVDGRPYSETVPVAWAILHHTVMDARLKKKAPEQVGTSPMTAAA